MHKHKSSNVPKGLGLEIHLESSSEKKKKKVKPKGESNIELYKNPFYKRNSSFIRSRKVVTEKNTKS